MVEDFSEPEESEKEWEWFVKITCVSNGFIVEHENDYGKMEKHLIVEPENTRYDDIPAGLQAGRELAYYIWDYFGMHQDKWSEHNLRVRVEPGFKLDGWKPDFDNSSEEEELSKTEISEEVSVDGDEDVEELRELSELEEE